MVRLCSMDVDRPLDSHAAVAPARSPGQPKDGDGRALGGPVATRLAALVITCAPLSLWFWSSFPWQHHNESLKWDVVLRQASFWSAAVSNPAGVANTRPLGLMVAWITFHVTDGGVWLQQLVNLVITLTAWCLACLACRRKLNFACLAFVCTGSYFSGFIYLFHIHGVFYGPLFLFMSLLLWQQARRSHLGWDSATFAFIGAVIAGLFHPFALLVFVCYLFGWWLETSARSIHRLKGIGVVIAGSAASIAFAILLLDNPSTLTLGTTHANPIDGFLTSYRLLEINSFVGVVSVLLAALTGTVIGCTSQQRVIFGTLSALGGVGLMLGGFPAILAWIVTCAISSVYRGWFARCGLLIGCTVLPVATATGSPTYAIFVLLPCCVITAETLPILIKSEAVQAVGAAIIAVITLFLVVALRGGWDPPILGRIALPLRSEQEKTVQLMAILDWLSKDKPLSGKVELCNPGGEPTSTQNALNRVHRAPTDMPFLLPYLKFHFGDRFLSGSPLYLCFGGEKKADSSELFSVPGHWAGSASVQRPNSRS